MSDGGGGGQQKTTTEPWSEQKPFLAGQGGVFPEAQRLYEQGPQQFYPGNLNAGFTQPEQQAQRGLLQQAQDLQQNQVPQISDAQQFALNAPQDVGTNPVYQNAISAAIQPMTEQFRTQVLPRINADAINAGQMGSSRHGVVQANAMDDLSQNMSNMSSQMMGRFMGQGLDAQSRALALAPQTMQAMTTPQQLQSQVGFQQRQMDQAQLDEQIARFQHEQQAPYNALARFRNMVVGGFGGTTTVPGPEQPSMLGAAGGGALAGYSATGNPYGALIGAGLGAASTL